MMRLFRLSFLLFSTGSAWAQFSTLAEPADPFAQNAFKEIRVDSVEGLQVEISRLIGDSHILLESGEYDLPVNFSLIKLIDEVLTVRISSAVGGRVELRGETYIQVQPGVSLELQRLRFRSDLGLNITGHDRVHIDSCQFDGGEVHWMPRGGASLNVLNSVFIKGAHWLTLVEEESKLSFLHNTFSGLEVACVKVMGEGLISLRLDNNIFSGQGAKALQATDDFNVILEGRNNLFHGWETIGLDGEERLMKNRMADPLLKEDGLHLTEKSPAINAGAALGGSVSGDIDGDYRGLRPDIGADEY